jgi:hypothetical protein
MTPLVISMTIISDTPSVESPRIIILTILEAPREYL